MLSWLDNSARILNLNFLAGGCRKNSLQPDVDKLARMK